ncbi:DUF6731 family protein [Shouchella lehensis]|uniref:Uncharacterized protein n=1 Tax=Shouchella lehensis TaxID=300825 RepID=A0A4Y7WJ66_9BACI|nr:DUF6731 family protein [Shouchella lehensis]MBG9785615.1 hypothetical protein [Shouchella lehensis]TES48068.1 hypothetical protein E2L03_13110 [Shouchella lehensis]
MPIKNIRFNYFTINLAPRDLPDDMQGRNYNASWDMTDMLNYLSVIGNEIDGVVNVGEYISEFDRHTLLNDRGGIFSFQIGKLRETNLAKKSIGNPKEELGLREDEYIGEFVTVVFDPRYCTVAVQSNIYSLNVSQVEIFLTDIRNRYNEIVERDDQFPLVVSLEPIIDPTKIDRIGRADIFRKVTIKGSNVMADSLADNESLEEISEVIGRARGVKFELTLSVGNAPKTETLNHETIHEIIRGFRESEPENKPNVELTARQNEDSPMDVVNLLTPRLTNVIRLNLNDNRAQIGHEFIHAQFMEAYETQRNQMRIILQPFN